MDPWKKNHNMFTFSNSVNNYIVFVCILNLLNNYIDWIWKREHMNYFFVIQDVRIRYLQNLLPLRLRIRCLHSRSIRHFSIIRTNRSDTWIITHLWININWQLHYWYILVIYDIILYLHIRLFARYKDM